ncbi:hypothetical protein [Streptomyces sp. enrichment culture]|uniref:hypothetical protein n=1 Tax=Streptomyces sp. enrichment culture TaxID=1795815 RepID=UPI003F5766C5
MSAEQTVPPEQTDVTQATVAVTGYRMLLPDQWAQVPLRQGTEEAVEAILEDAYTRIPKDAPPVKAGPYKRELARRFRPTVAQAQEAKALDLYLPVKPVGDGTFNLGASILVSETVLPRRGERQASEPTEVAVLLSRDGVEGVGLGSGEIDGVLAVRP